MDTGVCLGGLWAGVGGGALPAEETDYMGVMIVG